MNQFDLPSSIGAGVAILAAIPVAAAAYTLPRSAPVWPVRLKFRAVPIYATALSSLASGVSAYVSCHRLGWHLATPGYWVFSVLGVGLAIVDLRTLRLPHAVTGTLWLFCGCLFLAESVYRGNVAQLASAAGSGVAVYLALLLVALMVPGQLGLGDVHFAGAIALTLGWIGPSVGAAAIFAAFLMQLFAIAIAKLTSRSLPGRLPLGPALYGAWLLVIAVAS